MIGFGTALKSKEPPYHRCVVLSDPKTNGGQVVLVRVTTDDGTWPDRDCILTPDDWPELRHASTVAYSTCKCGPATVALETAIKKRQFEVVPSPSPEVLKKMIEAGRRSAGMPPIAKSFLKSTER